LSLQGGMPLLKLPILKSKLSGSFERLNANNTTQHSGNASRMDLYKFQRVDEV